MMKSTKEFWARKQFTDSASMEHFVLNKQANKQSNSNLTNIRDEVVESSSFAGKETLKAVIYFVKKDSS